MNACTVTYFDDEYYIGARIGESCAGGVAAAVRGERETVEVCRSRGAGDLLTD